MMLNAEPDVLSKIDDLAKTSDVGFDANTLSFDVSERTGIDLETSRTILRVLSYLHDRSIEMNKDAEQSVSELREAASKIGIEISDRAVPIVRNLLDYNAQYERETAARKMATADQPHFVGLRG